MFKITPLTKELPTETVEFYGLQFTCTMTSYMWIFEQNNITIIIRDHRENNDGFEVDIYYTTNPSDINSRSIDIFSEYDFGRNLHELLLKAVNELFFYIQNLETDLVKLKSNIEHNTFEEVKSILNIKDILE